jgi:eukaryotic-like serine/threonine-protein kinase
VYEAVDEKLDRRVALKCALTGFRNRMPPEARAACEVSHFNVCKVHDLHVASTPLGEVEFLSMEFIDGETLSAHIERAGPMSSDGARDLGRQICAGLEQLHRQGVIHGDLKCSNIILAQAPEGGSRPVITDFGLAKLKTGTGGSGRMSGQAGTFDYMAPELLRGEQISVASDLYALGVVFHTMLTGEAPKQGGMPKVGERPGAAVPSLGNQVLDTDAATVTKVAEQAIANAEWTRELADLPSPWKRIVKKCLAPEASDRFSSASQVEQALGPRPLALRWTWAAMVALIAALVWWQFRENPTGPPVRLAVLPAVIEGPSMASAAGIATDVAHRLLGLRGNFTVIPPAEALRNKVDTSDQAKSVLGATHILQTRFRNSGTQIVALASISDVGSGQVLRELRGTYSSSDTALLAKALIATATGAFGLRAGVPHESVSGPAYSSYVQGLTLMSRDMHSADEAIPYFNKAIEIDPVSALPYAGLAEAQIQNYQRGMGSKWLDLAAANIAKAKSINADAVPVLLTSGILQQEHGWYEQAARDFNRAAELEPNNSDAWRLLASIYNKTNRTEEAIATYQKAISAQPNYYRHYLDFGNFYFFRSEFRQAEELQRRVTAIAPNLAEGHMDLGLALMEQGRFQEAETSLLHALRLSRTPQILGNVGALYYGDEKFEEALSYFQASLAEGASSAFFYTDLGDAFRHLGRDSEAADAYRKASALAEEQLVGNPRQAYIRVLLAQVSARLGNPGRAEFELRQALSMAPENAIVTRHAVLTYEILQERQKGLDLLRGVPVQAIEELGRSPDAKDLRRDPRFEDLILKQ